MKDNFKPITPNDFMKQMYYGISPILSSISKLQNVSQPFTGLESFSKLVQGFKNDTMIESVIKGINNRNLALTPSLDLVSFAKQVQSISKSVKDMNTGFLELTRSNQILADKLSNAFKNQLTLSYSLNELVKSVQLPAFKNFNALSLTIENFSISYLDLIIKTKDWENLEIFELTNEKIKAVAKEYVSETQQITTDDLTAIKNEIIFELTSVLEKIKNNNIRQLFFELIAILSFLLTFYSANYAKKDISNREVLEETKVEISKLKSDIRDMVQSEFDKLKNRRIAIRDVNLRYSANNKSQLLGVVKEGQEVIVLEIRHKWLLITYVDQETKKPKSGFVFKKHFEVEK
jgi:hypothetical protein